MIYLVNYNDIPIPGLPVVTVTSRSKTLGRQLSPFLLGPVDLYGGYVAQNVENAWQYSKVYAKFIDKDGSVSKNYFDWAIAGWSAKNAVRYPMNKGQKPEFSYWNGERLTYVEARKKIYIPLYKMAAINTLAYKKLKAMYDTGIDFCIRDFDVYRYDKLGYSWEDVINDPVRKCGHGFVLAMMLEGYL